VPEKKRKMIQCQLCGRKMAQITVRHLEVYHPEVSIEEYQRQFKGTTSGQLQLAAAPKETTAALAQTVAERILADKGILDSITDRVGQTLFSGKTKEHIIGAVLAALQLRLGTLNVAAERVARLNEELFEDWRLKEGGPDGAPTPTDQLVRMGYLASGDAHNIVDEIIRMANLVVQENHGAMAPSVNVNLFSGLHEKIPMPGDMTPDRREKVRVFIENVIRPKADIPALIAKARALRDDEEEKVVEAEIVPPKPKS